MGFFDKLKGAVNAVTGGGAKITLELGATGAYPGQQLRVRVTAVSTGAEVTSKGAFVDLMAVEQIRVPKSAVQNLQQDISVNNTTFQQEIQIAPEFKLAAGETKYFEAVITIPPTAQPSYDGPQADHGWAIRGRIDTFGNDPDSGYQPIKIGIGV
jgi:hypothetical protein